MKRARWLAFLSIFTAVILSVPGLSAQYFGQNKVRYQRLDFQVLKTEHFDIYYYPEEKLAVEHAARMAERWNTRLSAIFNWQLKGRQPLVLYHSHPAFTQTTVTPEIIGQGTGGFTEPLRRRIVMPFAGPMGETDHVLGHELVHAFQFDMMPAQGIGAGGNVNLPLWFIEGLAEYLSVGPADSNTMMWMRDAVLRDDLPTLNRLNTGPYFPYRWGQAFWAYVGGRYGDHLVGRTMLIATDRGVEAAIAEVLQTSADELFQGWHAALLSAIQPVLRVTTASDDAARLLLRERGPGGMNVSPALSPDGKHLMFLSEKGSFDINIFLADAQTGRVIRRITETAVSPHFVNLQFINSAGSWNADSTQFAFGHVTGATPGISIYDLERDDIVRDIPLEGLGEVFSPTWSPDGREIAFSASAGGLMDLYVVEVESGAMRRLTNDEFAELQPAWAPSGNSIAFVTDRFSSDLSDLTFGRMELALIDARSGDIQRVPTFAAGKSIDPHWSADGVSLFFISDRDGISNVYRLAMASGEIRQLTTLQTGVSGITALSPALSTATAAGRVVYSTFNNSGYEIVRIDGASELAGEPPSMRLSGMAANILPPRDQVGGEVAAALSSPRQGLVEGGGFQTARYSPRLSLDYVAPPQVGVGFSSFGSMVSGGIGFHFGDMLGQHDLTLVMQTGFASQARNILRNLAGQALYLNQRSRWNWGFFGGQVPYQSGGFTQGVATVEGQPALINQQVTFWQIERQVGTVFQYPISRGQRLEFDAGYNNIAFAGQAQTEAFSTTGNLLFTSRDDIPTANALHLGVADAALVGDTSVFGGTAPIMGQRYRFQAGISRGSLSYYTMLADYRRYIRLAGPLSFAARGLHYGRYGGGSEDPRMQGFFLGYPALVHGYNANSFNLTECGPEFEANGSCPTFDRLVGSRMLVGNAEVRLETLGPFGLVPNTRGLPPVTAAVFFDAGQAWTSQQDAGFLGGPRRAVSSYGGALRVNVWGIFVGEVSAAHPNNRPGRNWIWQFSLTQAF